MTVDELIVYGKSKVSSTHAKMLLAILLNISTLELLTKLEDKVPDDIVKVQKKNGPMLSSAGRIRGQRERLHKKLTIDPCVISLPKCSNYIKKK